MSAPNSILQGHRRRWLRGAMIFVFTLLAIEFLDELVFGAREAAWPLIRNDLGLSYAQIGLLLGVPNLVAAFIEPVLGILGDVWKRWLLIVGGGVLFTLALVLFGLAPSFAVLMAASIVFYPASGAFVSLSQSSLMDHDPSRHEHLMARWTLAGSVGVVAGPLLLGLAVWLGVSWRGAFVALVPLSLVLTVAAWAQLRRSRKPSADTDGDETPQSMRDGLRQAARAARRPDVLRWLVLLAFSDFMLDVLLGFLALYFVDVVKVSPALAGTSVAVWSGVGLLGDALLIPLLERMRGLTYLRYSALAMLCLFPVFLVVPWYAAKLVLLALMGLGNAGWYAILKGQLFSSLPGQSGTVMAIDSAFSLVAGATPALLGFVAQRAGLPVTMWLLLLGPIALLIGIPRLGRHLPVAEPEHSEKADL
jgi:FSR family fosmidomycin resistance protein-like MFS transporter